MAIQLLLGYVRQLEAQGSCPQPTRGVSRRVIGSVEIDLNEEHAAALDDALATYIEHARQVERAAEGLRRRRKPEQERRRQPEELRAIRQWARDQGL